MTVRLLTSFLVVLFVWLGPGQLAAQSTVCRLPGIQGFDAAAKRAKHAIGVSTTRDVSEMKVFVTVESGDLYVHSNFISAGFDLPTKIRTAETDVDINVLVENLVFTEPGPSRAEVRTAVRNASFYVDEALLKDSRFSSLDFNGAKNVHLAGETNSLVKQLRNGTARWFVEASDHIYVRFGDHQTHAKNLQGLRGVRFTADELKVVSLVTNTATNRAIDTHLAGKRVPFDHSSIAALESALQGSRGGTLVVIGHVEGESFVTRNAGGSEILRAPIKALERIASEHGMVFVPLGCNSARAGTVVGAATAFNTVDAVERLAVAAKSTDYYGFLRNLAAPGTQSELALVVDAAVIRREAQVARVDVDSVVIHHRPDTVVDVHTNVVGSIRLIGVALPISLVPPRATSGGDTGGSDDASGWLWLVVGGISVIALVRWSRRGL